MKSSIFSSSSPFRGMWETGWWNGVAFVLYCAAAQVGLQLASLHGDVSPFWPPSGVAVAVLVLAGNRVWPAIALGAFLANLLTPVSGPIALAIAFGNVLEALLAAWIYRRVASLPALQGFGPLAAWMAAALIAPIIPAGLGAGAMWMNGGVSVGFGKLLLTWWAGDSIGIWLVGPAVLAVGTWRASSSKVSLLFIFKALVLVGILLAGCNYIFRQPSGSEFLFLTFPILLLATIWFGGTGAKLASVGIALFALFAVGFANAPFEAANLNDIHLQLEGFLFAMAITAQVLAVMDESRCVRLPSLVLLVGWGIGGWIFSQLDHERLSLDRLRFLSLTNEAQESIRQRMNTYVDALRGGVSLFASSDDVTRQEWRRYVESLDLVDRYPGIGGVGVVFSVRENELPAFLSRVRAGGFPEFAIHSVPNAKPPPLDGGGGKYFVVTFLEPMEANFPAVGLDLASEKNRQAAARLSRDYGVPRITSRINLTVNGRSGTGFLLYLPMYRPGQKHDSVHARRQAFAGWVYAPFITADFLRGILGSQEDHLRLSLFEGVGTAPANRLFSSIPNQGTQFKRTTVLELAGQPFTCGWNPGPGFAVFRPDPLLNAITLAVVPALLAGLVISLQTFGRRATELAEERTREWREINARLEVEMGERRNAETEAQKAQAVAEKASAAKSEFLATMSHEIRTPMNGIIGYADLLEQSPLNGEQQSWVRIIQSSSGALLTLINDILDFSKIEAGRLKLERIAFDPLGCVREVVEITQIQADLKKLPVSVHCENAVPERIQGDPVRFKQILLNLVSNAIKFTKKGSVRVTLEQVGEESARRLRIEVQDTGMGIPKEKLSRLFRRFSQVDSSTTRRFGGTGLGLAICKHLIHLMHGKIGVAAGQKVGTTIWFELPIEIGLHELPPVLPTPAAESATLVGRGKRVLVAEDVPTNQKLAKILLTRLGCEVDLVDNGREAVKRAISGGYDLIYMDCQMPELDGFGATAEIRADARCRLVPIVALTAGALDGDREKCLAAGMNDYLTKPLTRSDLLRSLEKWAGSGIKS